jgi:basic membrane protein A
VFVPDAGGANDFGLNALTLRGLRAEASRDRLPPPAVGPAGDPEGALEAVGGAARLVVGYGASQADAFQATARAHATVMFVLVDSPPLADISNLRTISFDLSDGAALAGRLAAGVSRTHTVAFVGGTETQEAGRLAASFSQGASGANVVTAFSGSDDNQAGAKRLAEGLISDRGADVLFAAAMPAGLGAIAAASQHRVLAIGLDRDDHDVAPNAMLSSVVKFTDVASASALSQFEQGTLTGGTTVLGAAQLGVGLAALGELADRVPPALRRQLGVPG